MKRTLPLLGCVGLLLGVLAIPARAGDVASYEVTMNGANEVPGPGDPDGTGTALIELGTVSNEVCVDSLTIDNLDQATMMHIHLGATGIAGDIVVTLTPAIDDTPFCTTVSADLMEALVTTPACYYLNVHTALFPAGAIRGQLDDAGQCTPDPGSSSTTSTAATSTTSGVRATATSPTFTG